MNQRHGNLRYSGGMVAVVAIFHFAVQAKVMAEAVPLADGAVDTVQLLERLKMDAVPRWRDMAEKLNGINFTYKLFETSQARGAARTRTKLVTGHVSGDCFLLEEVSDAPAHTSVYGRNVRYEFSIDRTGKLPWVITWQGGPRKLETPVGSAFDYLVGMMQLPWSISATPLEKLVRDPRFKITHASSKTGVVEFEFEVAPGTERPDPLQNLVGGNVALDSVHRWAIVRYEVRYLSKMASSVGLAYGSAGPPELRRVEFKLDSPPNNGTKFLLSDFHYDTNAVDTASFTLATYGLPEYREPFSARRWLVLINIGILLVLLGVILFRRKQTSRGRTVRGAKAGTVMF